MKTSPLRNQEGLAEALGTDQTTVSKWITGKTKTIPWERLAAIERVCGLIPGQILGWSGLLHPDIEIVGTGATTQPLTDEQFGQAAHDGRVTEAARAEAAAGARAKVKQTASARPRGVPTNRDPEPGA